MQITLSSEKIANLLAEELALQSIRAAGAGLSLTAYLIDMAVLEVRRESVKIALPHSPASIILPGTAG